MRDYTLYNRETNIILSISIIKSYNYIRFNLSNLD